MKIINAVIAAAVVALAGCGGSSGGYQWQCQISPVSSYGGQYGELSVTLTNKGSQPLDPSAWGVFVFAPGGAQQATAPFPAAWQGAVAPGAAMTYTGGDLYPVADTCQVSPSGN